jgi:hypothetical protein
MTYGRLLAAFKATKQPVPFCEIERAVQAALMAGFDVVEISITQSIEIRWFARADKPWVDIFASMSKKYSACCRAWQWYPHKSI